MHTSSSLIDLEYVNSGADPTPVITLDLKLPIVPADEAEGTTELYLRWQKITHTMAPLSPPAALLLKFGNVAGQSSVVRQPPLAVQFTDRVIVPYDLMRVYSNPLYLGTVTSIITKGYITVLTNEGAAIPMANAVFSLEVRKTWKK